MHLCECTWLCLLHAALLKWLQVIFFTVILLFYVRAIFVSTKVKIVIVYLNAFSFVSSSVVKLQPNFLPLSVCQRLYILELLIWVPQSLIYQINQFNGNFGKRFCNMQKYLRINLGFLFVFFKCLSVFYFCFSATVLLICFYEFMGFMYGFSVE